MLSRVRLVTARSAQAALLHARAARPALVAGAIWIFPVAVIWLIYFSPRHIVSADKAIAYLIGVGIIILASRRPDRSLIILILFLPIGPMVLAKLFALGLPEAVVAHLSAWKECLALGVVVAGARNFIARGRRADTLDRVALGFVALVALYAALQQVFVPGAPSPLNVKLLAFRETAGFVLLLLGARHAPLPPGFAERAMKAVFFMGAVVAAIGVFEAADSSAWNQFVVRTVQYPTYQFDVLHTVPPNPLDIRVYGFLGGHRFVRVGSVFIDALSCSWYLILPFAIGMERAIRRTASPLLVLATVLIAAALVLTQTRSAIFGALVVATLCLAPAAGRQHHWRTQVAVLLCALAVFGIPGAFASGVASRVQQISNTGDTSTAGHLNGLKQGFQTMENNGLGKGIGTAAGTGQRIGTTGFVIPENYYLEMGDELGFIGLLSFVALVIALVRFLRRGTRASPQPLIAATWASAIGLSVAAWFLQTWNTLIVAWTFWGVAGAMVAVGYQRVTEPRSSPAQSELAPMEVIPAPSPAPAGSPQSW